MVGGHLQERHMGDRRSHREWCLRRMIFSHDVQGAEAYGIFCIGEMIGRRNVVGYKLEE